MRTIILVLASLVFYCGQASADACPDFFRFVDFGLDTPDGVTRGGPTYRAESFDGQALAIAELTVCRDALNLAVDGRGNPIPVVASINYAPEKTGIDLKELRLTGVDDVALQAEGNADDHRARLDRKTAVKSRGPDYLCARLEEPNEISCQFVSPFGGNLALVIYCDPSACRMPVLALNEKVIATAVWQPSEASLRDQEAAPLEIGDKVQQIHDFLAPLSSWKPRFTRLDR